MAADNRLAGELSPYLLQHAGNPVDWQPWGPRAFELARTRDKPLFLSIGYSTCHWCHVMEREAFEDPECARLLNEACVPVKVDREERPDLDAVYMTAAQVLGNQGGWPLNLLLTSRGLPFFAATYLPPESAFGRMGLKDLCRRVVDLWRERRADLEAEAEDLARRLRFLENGDTGPMPGPELMRDAFSELAARFDPVHGGFGNAPKFPAPHTLLFLLRFGSRQGEPRAVDMAAATLRAMRRGGLFDQVGFGFHRYSTDRQWLLPHFEKMLYDQALLALACAEAFRITGAGDFADTAREVLAYVLRDLADPAGGFRTAEDADAEGVEGGFYVFGLEEFRRIAGDVLPGREALLARVFGLKPEGNFHDEATGRTTGANVLHLPLPLEEAAASEGLEPGELAAMLEILRPALLEARNRRPRPFRDDKVLTDWNGLMIAALAACGRILDEPGPADAAERAAGFVRRDLRDAEGRLLHRWRQGRAGLPGLLDDHAFLAWGLLELERVRPGRGWADQALELAEALRGRFRHPGGGFFLAPAENGDGPALPFRPREVQDGALPSGNSVALHVLLRLARAFGRPDLEDEAGALLTGLCGAARRFPSAHTHFLSGLGLFLDPGWEG